MDFSQFLGIDSLRWTFLISLTVTAVLFLLRTGGAVLNLRDLFEVVIDFLLVPFALLTGLTFFIIITGADATALRLKFSQVVSGQRNVSFLDAIPPELQDTFSVAKVSRIDTDGDGFEEWLVFYEYDLKGGGNPVTGVIYDNDRGIPPVIFPYQLRIPDRTYLSENQRAVNFSLQQITSESNGLNGEDLPELMVFDYRQRSMFRFNKENLNANPDPAAPPNNNPERYQAIGSFYGSGGVTFNDESKEVTVFDRDKFTRSQLMVRSIYGLQTDGQFASYWDPRVPLGEEQIPTLAEPLMTTIDFYTTAPQDIFATSYPEKIVLGFYASTCGSQDKTLCRNRNEGWQPDMFTSEDSEAWRAVENRDASYFGLDSLNSNQNITVSDIRYYPRIEVESSEKLATGPTPQDNVVDIIFKVGNAPEQGLRFVMELVNGEWKVVKKLGPSDIPLDENEFLPSVESVSEVGSTLQ